MRVPVARRAGQLTDSDFSEEDVAQFHRLMTDLAALCGAVGERRTPDGAWAPASSGLFEQFGESMQLIAEISRKLNTTRGGIRRIHGRARERGRLRSLGRIR
ncbi:hypothetical protein ACFPC0_12090 [Streptomyces andamanensis]|uniref:WXG100 family type VII secretion target n=1 Tax=Streptomyces andamanensis TaxID=1565035 RepID=A0ABV8TDL5_9ACTN|nr:MULTISPECIES: hypothetical protein [unclassified Streptomyces]EYT80047.1 hypothetical protein CF54_27685 [Streptomyces sp. Tu 6176]